jgi:hypothetical protein
LTSPILLDLDGDGIEVTELSRSQKFADTEGDGKEHRIAWAGVGDAVLFYDADGDGVISDKREFIFTEWDPTATSDLETLRSVFDSNGDGVFNAQDDKFGQFKLEVVNADGSTTVKTLAQAGIAAIDLTGDVTHIELPDGSVITGQTTFTKTNGATGTVANATLAYNAKGNRVMAVTG